MKITFLCEQFTRSSFLMEPWRHVYELSKRIMRNGNIVSVITDGFPKLPREEEVDGIHIYRVRKKALLFNRDELLQGMNESDADIINWHSGPMSSVYFCWLHKLIRKDIVWTIYFGGVSWRDLRNINANEILSLNEFWYFFLQSLLPDYFLRKGANIRQIRRLTTKSQRQKDYLLKVGVPEKKIVVIPPGVNTNEFKQPRGFHEYNTKMKMGFSPDNFVVLYFGSASPFRGLDTVLEAMRLVSKELKSIKLLILSRQTPYDSQSKLLNKVSCKTESIKIVNRVLDQETLIEYLAVADAVVLPFKFWPVTDIPLTILEAMSMQKPVVTCPVGGIPEIVKNGETGVLVDPNNPQKVAKALIELWKNKELARKIGERARRCILESYTWDSVTQQTMLLFKQCMDEQNLSDC